MCPGRTKKTYALATIVIAPVTASVSVIGNNSDDALALFSSAPACSAFGS